MLKQIRNRSVPAVVAAILALALTGDRSTGQAPMPPAVVGFGVLAFDTSLHDATDFVAVAAGHAHTLARRADGRVEAFGWNLFGQCSVPPLPSGATYTQGVAAGLQSLLLRSDGQILGGVAGFATPALPAGARYVAVTASPWHAVAQRSDGAVVAWGANSQGQCNVPPLPTGISYVELKAAGATRYQLGGQLGCLGPLCPPYGHTVALRSDGVVVAFGDNRWGQCDVPALPPGLRCVEVAAGDFHGLARRSDGSVVAWGSNAEGQCNVPALPAGITYVGIAAGGSHNMARRSDGSIVLWGDNSYGQCSPPPPPPGVSYVDVACGDRHSVGLRSDGRIVAWGNNQYAQCNTPAAAPGSTFVDVAIGGYESDLGFRLGGFVVLRTSDGSLTGIGDDQFGQATPPPLPAGVHYSAIACGAAHAVALWSDGTLVAWGANHGGQTTPPPLPTGLAYRQIACGSAHSLARRSDGNIVAFGANDSGQCTVPALPPGLTYTDVAAGDFHSIALRSDGAVVTWGAIRDHAPDLPAGVHYVAVDADSTPASPGDPTGRWSCSVAKASRPRSSQRRPGSPSSTSQAACWHGAPMGA